MSVKYTPVQWTNSKIFYDVVLALLAGAYVLLFLRLAPELLDHEKTADGAIVRARAFGTCAFLMLTVILCIGPLARLNKAFLPLLYNRRHFGVMTFFVGLTHAIFVLDWYFNFSPTPRVTALLGSNTSYAQLLGFPFEILGVFALLSMAVLAATSHDFWLRFLTPPVWKSLHYLLYPAYAALVGHVALGALQSQENSTFALVTGASVALVCGLHVIAATFDRSKDRRAESDAGWHDVARVTAFEEGYARIARLSTGERVAVFLNDGELSAIGNACAHQNGPLGEGKILDGCVTCPWHGFQYRLSDGCSPEPFTEKVPTYNLRLNGEMVQVSGVANALGTVVAPVRVSGAAS
ncbi:MAG: Rieske 2Fe-2S domain-containing protein [Pseudomonadota bacterium]